MYGLGLLDLEHPLLYRGPQAFSCPNNYRVICACVTGQLIHMLRDYMSSPLTATGIELAQYGVSTIGAGITVQEHS